MGKLRKALGAALKKSFLEKKEEDLLRNRASHGKYLWEKKASTHFGCLIYIQKRLNRGRMVQSWRGKSLLLKRLAGGCGTVVKVFFLGENSSVTRV